MSSSPVSILSTKQLPPNLLQYGLDAGLSIDCIPFISTAPVLDIELTNSIARLALKKIYAVFTSGIAANAVAAMLMHPAHWNIYCLNGQTRKNIESVFPHSTIAGTAWNGKALAEAIIAGGQTRELYFFCGNRRLDTLPDELASVGIVLKEFVVYSTELTPAKVAEDYKAILFYSPSGVESFFSANQLTDDVLLLSIGATTTKAIEKYSLNKVYTAAKAEPHAMVELAKQLLQTNR